MAENQTIKERLILYIKFLGIGQGKFEAKCKVLYLIYWYSII